MSGLSCVHGFEPEDVAEKGAVSVFTVDNYVCAGNHLPLIINARNYACRLPSQGAPYVERTIWEKQVRK
jgi:hypothetical protein